MTVAWISDFPVEWLPDVPASLRHLPRRHPATWQIVLLSEFEKRADLRLHVILLRRRIDAEVSFECNGVTFHVLKASAALRLGSLFWIDTFLIRKACRKVKPDLIHAWGTEKGAALIASRLKQPYLVTVQGLFAWYKQRVKLAPYFQFIERLERISLPRAPLVTTESAFAVQFLREHFPQVRVHQAEHAPNHAFFCVQRKPETNPAHFIAVGEPSHRKGTDLLFAALEKLDIPFKLTMVCGPDSEYLKSLLANIPARIYHSVELKHHILPNQVAKTLETPTLMLLPTRADVSPNAVKEAVVAGVPVVASNIGGVPDYVRAGENGLLFAPNDLDSFVKAIREALNHPLFGRGEVGAASLVRSRDYLSPERMAENFLTAYDLALKT